MRDSLAFSIFRTKEREVTLLSILGSNAIAVPLSATFPASELRYILNNSQSSRLLSSARFQAKAEEVVSEGLESSCALDVLDIGEPESATPSRVEIQDGSSDTGGMMLYTSGTTSRPVGRLFKYIKCIH